MTVGITTLGCKVNLYESEFIINKLEQNGYIVQDFDDVCDIYIINTCSVTNQSDNKSKKLIRKAIKTNPDALVIAMGCFIEANHDYKEDGLDIVIGNKDKNKIIEIIDKYFKDKEEAKYFEPIGDKFEDMFINNFKGRTRAFVKIQDGCENFCAFCIIPYVRGVCRSKDQDKVIEEIKELVSNNYKEIVLTGIHTGSYGRDKNTNLEELLKEIVKIDGLKRVRISSIELNEITDGILKLMKDYDVICEHLHIPLQAGSDKILNLMKRQYNKEQFKNRIMEIKNMFPNIMIATDVIVGFPNETEEDFQETLDFCKELSFAKIHVFPYSERKGTKAADMDNKVDQHIKHERVKRLMDLSKKLEIEYMKSFINKEVEVLVEQSKEDRSFGHTSNYLEIKVNEKLEENTLVKVEVVDIDYPHTIAKVK